MSATAATEELTRAECIDLLRSCQVGRVVLTHRALPVALPVNYAVDGDAVVFRTESGILLSAAMAGSVVAFQVDSVDVASRTGWSVLVTGVMREIADVSELLRAEQLNLQSWGVTDRATHFVRVPFAMLTGRRILPERRSA